MEPGILQARTRHDLMMIFLFELIGTSIMLLGICLAKDNVGAAVSCIFSAALLCYRISGAHFNLSLTFAIYIVEGKWRDNLPILAITYLGS